MKNRHTKRKQKIASPPPLVVEDAVLKLHKEDYDETNKRRPHALDSVVLGSWKSWQDRVREWRETQMSFEERMGWLHNYGREGNGPDQFIFYLEVADGYGDPNCFFHAPGTYGAVHKHKLSQKAFTMLCSTFFRKDAHEVPLFTEYKEPLFSKLLWFFRPGFKGGLGGWDNLRPYETEGLAKDDGSHYLETATAYAETFTLNAWQMLNNVWYIMSDGEKPDPSVAYCHWYEIVALLQRFRMYDYLKMGQYAPTYKNYVRLVELLLRKHNSYYPDTFDQVQVLKSGDILEPYVRQGDELANMLYLARHHLNPNTPKRDSLFCDAYVLK